MCIRDRAGTAMVGFQPIAGLNTFRMLFMNPTVTTTDIDAILACISEYGHKAMSAIDPGS